LTLHNNGFVHRQLSFCGLYLRTLSQNQRAICGKPACFDLDSIFPLFGTLGPAMIKDGHILVTVSWEDQGWRVLRIRQDIAELNRQGYFFLVKGVVSAGKIQTIPNRYAKVAPICQ
jgi:hypothetical protein